MILTEAEIEAFAVQIAEPDFEISHAALDPLIGHLDPADFDAVMDRAQEIARAQGKAALAEAATLENLQRLAHASGMPDGGSPFPWLLERGLIEETDDGWRFKTAKPGAVT
jgi:hypothetical protein